MTFRSLTFLAGALGLAFVAAVPVSSNVPLPAPKGTACVAGAVRPWTPVRGQEFRTEAYSHGPTCALAVVTLIVRAPNRSVLWAEAAPAAHVMTFAGITTSAEMVKALSEWLSQDHMFRSSADFPPWAAGDEAPKSGEFPFYPEAGIDRETFEQIRAQRLPVFCYVQGMESLACLTVTRDGQMEKVGVQLFPG